MIIIFFPAFKINAADTNNNIYIVNNIILNSVYNRILERKL